MCDNDLWDCSRDWRAKDLHSHSLSQQLDNTFHLVIMKFLLTPAAALLAAASSAGARGKLASLNKTIANLVNMTMTF